MRYCSLLDVLNVGATGKKKEKRNQNMYYMFNIIWCGMEMLNAWKKSNIFYNGISKFLAFY